jgi:hypothetical protein
MAALWYAAAALIAALLVAGYVSDVLAHRRVRSVEAHEVSPEAVRYVSLRASEDGR